MVVNKKEFELALPHKDQYGIKIIVLLTMLRGHPFEGLASDWSVSFGTELWVGLSQETHLDLQQTDSNCSMGHHFAQFYEVLSSASAVASKSREWQEAKVQHAG